MNRIETAVSCFLQGFLCSQAVLSAFSPDLGLPRDTSLRLAASFGAGMGRMGLTCGAVTGALMVLGLKYGQSDLEDKEAREENYEKVREFVELFRVRHGSIRCRDLLDCDINAPGGIEYARKNNLFTTLCPGYVRDAAEILVSLL